MPFYPHLLFGLRPGHPPALRTLLDLTPVGRGAREARDDDTNEPREGPYRNIV